MANKIGQRVRTSDLREDTTSLQNYVEHFVAPFAPYSPEILQTALAYYDGDNASLAVALSGTSNKKSSAYKAAIRQVQYWTAKDESKRKSPGKAYQKRITRLVYDLGLLDPEKLKDAPQHVKGVWTVKIKGFIVISKSLPEYRTMHATFKDRDKFQQFLELALEGKQDDALKVFAKADYPLDDGFSIYSGKDQMGNTVNVDVTFE